MNESQLLAVGAIRPRCSETANGYCASCGGIYLPDEAAGSDSDRCPVCPSQPEFAYFKCSRCEGQLNALPDGEHACKSLEQFRATSRITFIDEARDALERIEREEREAAERRRREEDERRRREEEKRRRREEEERRRREEEELRRKEVEARALRKKMLIWGMASLLLIAGVGYGTQFLGYGKIVIAAAFLGIVAAVVTNQSGGAGLVLAAIIFVFAGATKYGWHKAFGDSASQGSSPITVAEPEAKRIDNPKMPSVERTPSEAQFESEERERLALAKQKSDLEANLRSTNFSSKETLTFGPITQRFYSSLRSVWIEVANKRDFQNDVSFRIAMGKASEYLMAYVHLDDDLIPEVIIKDAYCSTDRCNLLVMKKMTSGYREGEYVYISQHNVKSVVGVTNEKICGFRAIYDEGNILNEAIKAEPMNMLSSAGISCNSVAPTLGQSHTNDLASSNKQEAQQAEQQAWEQANLTQAALQKAQREAAIREDAQWKQIINSDSGSIVEPASTGKVTVQSFLEKYPNKLEEIKTLANRGDAESQASLARMYGNGWGISKDEQKGLMWARKAAEQGNAMAQMSLGVIYLYGRGVSKDEAEAVKWYRKSAEQGNANGQNNLGLMYQNGIGGLTVDRREAVRLYRLAAAQGNTRAQANLHELGEAGSKALATFGDQQPNVSIVSVMEQKAPITDAGVAGMACSADSDCNAGLFCYRISSSCQFVPENLLKAK